MRYVFVMAAMFMVSDAATAQTLLRGGLEIRSLPVVKKKPFRRLLHRLDRMIRGKDIGDYFPLGRDIPVRTTMITTFLTPLPLLFLPVISFLPEASANITAAAIGLSVPLTFVGGYGLSLWYGKRERRAQKMVGKYVHYTALRDGRPTSWLGEVLGKDNDTGALIVRTNEGGVRGKNYVLPFDVKGIAIADHPDLHRRVSFLSDAEDKDLYIAGKLIRVYSDGHYEIEIDTRVDYDLSETPVNEPHTIFVHVSLPRVDGGFAFSDIGQTSAYAEDEAALLAASAVQANSAHDLVDSAHGQVDPVH